MRRFLSLSDAPGDELKDLLRLAARLKAQGPDPTLLAGRQLALLFLNPSLRTRASMELAAQSMGANVVSLSPGADAWKVELRRGVVMDGDAAEHLVEAVRVLSEMSDAVGVRTFAGLKSYEEDRSEPVLSMVDKESDVPVVNMESALDHPLQALADLQTMQEEIGEDLAGVPVALTWAPHPRALPMAVASAFLRGTARMGMNVRVAMPTDLSLPAALIDEARAMLPGSGSITVHHEQEEALEGARVICAKAWAAPALYGTAPEISKSARMARRDWMVSSRKMELGDDAIFLHCLPVRRNMVVSDRVLDGPRSRVIQEAGNRLHTARAVLATLLGGAGCRTCRA
jgi:N-acetylornithine carbamoyltransferase